MNSEILSIYANRLAQFLKEQKQKKRSLNFLSAYRVIAFIGIFASIYVIGNYSRLLAILSGILMLIIFLFLLRKFFSISQVYQLKTELAAINRKEIEVVKGNFEHNDPGTGFINQEHSYSFDLDLFGAGSLFQYLNRAAVNLGAVELASQLKNPVLDQEILLKRQEAIDELSTKLDWRQHFIAHGKLSHSEDDDVQKLYNWTDATPFFRSKTIQWISYLLSGITVTIIVLNILKLLPFTLIVTTIIYQMAFYTFFFKGINSYHSRISKYSKILGKYATLFKMIEKEAWTSELLKNSMHHLKKKGNASHEIRKLSSLIGAFDSRLNMLLGFILNWIFLWDIQCIFRLDDWKHKNRDQIRQWFKVLAETDTLQSFANYRFNNPAFVFPEMTIDNFVLEAKELGHPLINQKTRVCNDFCMSGYSKFSIVTGANMAGKSTFLRTMGVNLILAMCGAPVCARSFRFTPIQVFSSMRTDDSLQRNKSYFFAELLRLKSIFDQLNQGKKLFLILDEILKGTNSKDKEIGSRAFLKKLIQLRSNGLIATHDLTLGVLEKEYPENINNLCFEISFDKEELIFDYKLYAGITQNLNASYLMQKMGIV